MLDVIPNLAYSLAIDLLKASNADLDALYAEDPEEPLNAFADEI